jgi:hypothetical protein
LETKKAVQREKVVAACIDADDENNNVENINHGAQAQPEHRFCIVKPYLPRPLCSHFPENRFSGDAAAVSAPV